MVMLVSTCTALIQAVGEAFSEYAASWRSAPRSVDSITSHERCPNAEISPSDDLSAHLLPLHADNYCVPTIADVLANLSGSLLAMTACTGAIASAGAEGFKPALQNLYKTKMATFQDVSKNFLQGYHDGFKH